MTAEERMRERAAQVSWFHSLAGQLIAAKIRALPLEGEQGEPVKDQRGAAALAAAAEHNRRNSVDSQQREPLSNGMQSDPHHHSRTEQEQLAEDMARAYLGPAPAREPAVEEVRHRLEIIADLVAERKRTYDLEAELDRLRRQLISASEAEEDAKRLRAENAALREKLQGGVVVPLKTAEHLAHLSLEVAGKCHICTPFRESVLAAAKERSRG